MKRCVHTNLTVNKTVRPLHYRIGKKHGLPTPVAIHFSIYLSIYLYISSDLSISRHITHPSVTDVKQLPWFIFGDIV